MAEKIPGWLERLLLPRLSALEGELKAFRGEAQGEFEAVHSEIRRLDEKIDSTRSELTMRLDGLEKRVDSAPLGRSRGKSRPP